MSDSSASGNAHVTPAKLGCGTLILIAFIVAMFSQVATDDLESDVTRLRGAVEELQETIDVQTEEIRALRQTIDSLLALGPR